MLIQGLGCDFQNEAAIMASIQMQLDLTFHARRELPFQVPANQMDGVPTVHSCPTSSGPAWVGPFSSPQHAIRPVEKLFKFEHSALAFAPACLPRPTARHSRIMRPGGRCGTDRSRPTFLHITFARGGLRAGARLSSVRTALIMATAAADGQSAAGAFVSAKTNGAS